MVVEFYPQWVRRRHRDFVVGVEADEFEGRAAGSFDDPLNIAIRNADHCVSAAVATAGTAKFEVSPPVEASHRSTQ